MSEPCTCEKDKPTCGHSCAKRAWILVALLLALGAGYVAGVAVERKKDAGKMADAEDAIALQAQNETLLAQMAVMQTDIAQADTEALANFRKNLGDKLEVLQAALLDERAKSAETTKQNAALKDALKAADVAVANLQANLSKAEQFRPAYEKAKAALEVALLEVVRLKETAIAQGAIIQDQSGRITAQSGQISLLEAHLDALSSDLEGARAQIDQLIRSRGGVYQQGGRPLQFRR